MTERWDQRLAEQITRLSAAKVLERISRARLQRDELDAELALLIDHAVSLGIGWPDIARAWVSAGRRPASITNADIATAPAVRTQCHSA
jgi:hypothetical protein